MSTSDSVVKILVSEGGYRELPQPMKIGSGSFSFAHALVGSNTANDLVVVVEIKPDTSDDLILRNIHGLTRALDVLRSKRSVTAVLTSGPAAPETLRSISRVCRVLPIGAPKGPDASDAVRSWLSVLLPLDQFAAAAATLDWETAFREETADDLDEVAEELIAAATGGAEAVEAVFAGAIRVAVEPALAEGDLG